MIFSDHANTLLQKFYMRDDEKTPIDTFKRTATCFSKGDAALAQRLVEYVSKGWFMFASPETANAVYEGEKVKGLPISCFLAYVPDSLEGLIEHSKEIRWLSVKGGGVGGHWSSVRSASDISPGVIPFIKTVDSDMEAYRQGKCYTGDTEVMTSNGWVRFDELTTSHLVGNVNDDLKLFFDKPLELVKEKHEGYLLNITTPNDSIDLLVTPNHSMVVDYKDAGGKEWKNKPVKVRAESLPRHNDARMFTSVSVRWGATKNTLTPYERFLIAFQADGHVQKSGCAFHLKKEKKINRLRNILESCEFSFREVKTNAGTTKFYIHAPEQGNKLFDWLSFKDISSNWCAEFLEELSNWDCHISDETRGFTYSTTNEYNASVVQAVAALANMTSRMTTYEEMGYNRKPLYTVYVRKNKHLTLQKVDKIKVPFNGFVYCATVSTGKLLVRRNGVVTVCGNTRKGSYAAYLDISHPDIMEFLNIRVPTGGDTYRKCFTIHNAINITDDFMKAVVEGKQWNLIDPNTKQVVNTVDARELFTEIVRVRFRTGEPYLNFIDTANKALNPYQYANGLRIKGSNLCNEIHLVTDEQRTAVCCLSSVNLEYFDEWKDTNMVQDLIVMLDNVLQFFIDNAPPELDRAVFSAVMERSLGLGAMGYHSYLQRKGLGWNDWRVPALNMAMFSRIKEQAVVASQKLAQERGEPEDIKGSGMRNAHLLAIAPNANTSVLLDTSPSIEPWFAPAFTTRTRAGTYLVKNKYLEKLLEAKGKNTDEVWKDIINHKGSVQHLDFLTEDEKEVYKTAYEIDQRGVVTAAAHRQPYICQGQSVNLFFPAGSDINYVVGTHIKAWKEGLKGLYYLRTESTAKADVVSFKIERNALKDSEACVACEG